MIILTDENFYDEMASLEGPVLVDFWAEWCGPCKKMLPILERLDQDYMAVGKINVDENPLVAAAFMINSIPTMILFEEGQPTKKMIGAKGYDALVKELEYGN